VPFELPNGWSWIRLADIASFGGGKTPSMENKGYWDNGTHLWVTSKDMKSNIINDSMMKISDEAIKIMQVYQPGTLLMVTRSGILRRMLPLAILGKEATVNQDLKTISIVAPVLPDYIFYAILANESMILKDYHKDGTTVDSINFDKFVEMLIPLPPISEQQRIIYTIETYLSLVEEIKVSENDILASIDSVKSKILDLAIHGKLVSQDANDEPASELLKRINPKAVASCDNPQYGKVPSSWVISTVGEVFTINPKTNIEDDTDAAFVPMTCVADGYSNSFVYECRKWGDIKKGFVHFQDNDVAVAKISPCLENRKSVVFRDLPNGIGAGTTELNVFRCGEVLPDYALFYFKSKMFIGSCAGTYNGVVGQQRVAKSFIQELPIGIPPYKEQIRIVSKVNELFSQLDMIEKSLHA